MAAEAGTYLDSSAIVKLATWESESAALRRFLLARKPHRSSALVWTEVVRAVAPMGDLAVREAAKTLSRIEQIRVNNKILDLAGTLSPFALRSLDAIHLATAVLLGPGVRVVVTYDHRMVEAAKELGLRVASPG